MPVFTAIASSIGIALFEAGVLASIGAVATFAQIVGGLTSALVLGAVSKALSPKPKPAGAGSVATLRDRTVNVRQPVTARRLVYGQVRVGGPVLFLHSTDNNQYLHLIVALAGHEVEEIGTVYFNDEELPLENIGGNAYRSDHQPSSGKYLGLVYLEKWRGHPDQQSSMLSVHAPDKWTAEHRLRGIAFLYVRLKWSADVFGAVGVPTVTAIVKGRKVYDPRAAATAWSDNAALCLADYLTDATYGLGAVYASEIDEAALISAANAADEFVALAAGDATFVADAASDELAPYSPSPRLLTGTRVRVSSTGSLPAPLAAATDYYWIMANAYRGRLATSLANARAGVGIDLTSAGSGTHTISRQAEPRFAANGTLESDASPKDNIQSLLTALGGQLVFAGGKWGVYPAVYRAPTVTLTRSDLRGPIRLQTRVSRRENFNAVKGVFVDPFSSWQPTDFPPLTNAAYQAEDDGERVWKDIELPFTLSVAAAQRLAKIELERARQPLTLTLPCKLTAFRNAVPDVVMVTDARFGWSAKPFEVRGWAFAIAEDEAGAPALGVDLRLRETASAVYDWNAGEETALDPAPNTDLPSPTVVLAPGAPAVAETLYVTRDGAGVKARAALSWTASADAFLDQYQVEYKLSADSAWTVAGRTTDTALALDDVAPGTYDFRVKAVNVLGVSSAWSASTNREIAGLLAPPTEPQGLTVSTIGGLAILRWTQSPDLDVRIGGKIVFRHSPLLAGAGWTGSTSIGEAVPGSDTVAVLPLKSGTYLAKAVDSSGIASAAAAAVSTKQATALAYANVTSISEDPGFAGAHSGTYAEAGTLKLAGAGLFDAIADLDAVASLDAHGGVAASGSYGFAAGIDRGGVARTRLTATIAASAVNVLDLVDSRSGPIDDWADFDGAAAASADAVVEVRATDDDPGGSPAWGAWQRLDSAEFLARAFQFRCRLTSDDPAYNIHVTGLDVSADEVV